MYVSVVSDGLFGNCQKSDRLLPDVYQYQLTPGQRQQLESVLFGLIESGYAWSHQYTQCVIANILLAYRSGVDFDLGFCTASQFPPASMSAGEEMVVPSWLSGGGSYDGFPPEIRPSNDRSPDEDYLGVPEVDSRQVKDVEEFLQGLSSEDLDMLEKYVVDSQIGEDLSERVDVPAEELEDTNVVRKLSEDDQRMNDDIGELRHSHNTA